jgi:16S rRNA (cytosine1402-N4)-methyltransferase
MKGFSYLGELPPGSVDGVLMDLGISSPQIDSPERGFSFRFDGPLDMRMDTTRGQSVADWLATAEVDQITEVIRDYGEERFAFQIAKALVARRQERGPISSTTDLAQLVADTVKTREPGQNPATRTFQAFRIFINAELAELEQALEASLLVMAPGARLVVISFHSLEDRIVKQFMAKHAKEVVDRRVPFAEPVKMRLKLCGRIRPSESEVRGNPRSRSAIMRMARAHRGAGMMRLSMFLLIATVSSALWLVHSHYESRRLFMALELARKESQRIEVDLDRMEVERRAQTTPLRVEKIARQQLQMRNVLTSHYPIRDHNGCSQHDHTCENICCALADAEQLDEPRSQCAVELQPFAGQQDASLAQQIDRGLDGFGVHGLGGPCSACSSDRQ